jgi:hypothetical protein
MNSETLQQPVEDYIIPLYDLGLSKSTIARMLTTEKRIVKTKIKTLQRQKKLRIRPQSWRSDDTLRATLKFAAHHIYVVKNRRPEVDKVTQLIQTKLSPLNELKIILEGMLTLETNLVLLREYTEDDFTSKSEKYFQIGTTPKKKVVEECWYEFLCYIKDECIILPDTVEGIKETLNLWFLETLDKSITFS